MTNYSLVDIKNKVEELAQVIGSAPTILPAFGQQNLDAHPYIEVDDLGNMFYIFSERGRELERFRTDKLDELLFRIFSSVTFTMACEFELNNRIEEKDCRRIIFDKQLELLRQLNKDWQQRENIEHQRILIEHPFQDNASIHGNYKALRFSFGK
ncbi:MAG: hypothetical protein CFE21_09445 [Bacteroidetes bacterium B1(2017)]|nr:MAG: hypothetical protein CFE21_09445 [Bacteroidetes bacterium B1(2017)]